MSPDRMSLPGRSFAAGKRELSDTAATFCAPAGSPNELATFICSILTQVDNASAISFGTFQTGMRLSLK